MEERDLQNYEIGFLVRNEEDAAEVAGAIKSHQGQIAQEAKIKRLRFAYPVEKEVSGYFGFILFACEPAQIKGLTAKLELSKAVLRSMIFKVEAPGLAERKESARGERTEKKAGEVSEKPFKKAGPEIVDNELLEKKLEEILK